MGQIYYSNLIVAAIVKMLSVDGNLQRRRQIKSIRRQIGILIGKNQHHANEFLTVIGALPSCKINPSKITRLQSLSGVTGLLLNI